MSRSRIAVLLSGLLLVAACAGPAAPTEAPTGAPTQAPTEAPTPDPRADWPTRLVLGLVPSREADVLIETAEPLAQALSDALGVEVESFVPTDYTGLVEAMGTGQADIGAFGPIALVQAADRHGAVVILQSVRRGAITYHTQWMTNEPDRFCTDEPVPNEDGLLHCNGTLEASEGPIGEDALANIAAGETVFFVGPASASGYFYPATQLQRATGMTLEDLDVQFSGGHDASVLAVYRGDAALAVSFDDAREVVMGDTPDVGERVVVFAYSDEIPNDGIAVRGDLPASLQEAIKQALLDYAATEAGTEVLNSIYQITDLVVADLAALDAARQVEANFGD